MRVVQIFEYIGVFGVVGDRHICIVAIIGFEFESLELIHISVDPQADRACHDPPEQVSRVETWWPEESSQFSPPLIA